MDELALFAGAGGGILGGKLLGWRTRCAVEIDAYARSVLLSRQRDGVLDRFPIWDDIRTFDGRPWRGAVDVVSGGFPCQDISSAGKREGLAGERSGLWGEMFRVVGEVQPRFVFAENSPHLRIHGLGTIVEGLTSLGYECRWCVLGAWHVGAPHKRDRMWILAHSNSQPDVEVKQGWCDREEGWKVGGEEEVNPSGHGRVRGVERVSCDADSESEPAFKINDEVAGVQGLGGALAAGESGWWTSEPDVGRVVNGMAGRLDRLKSIGNGQVPLVAARAFTILSEGWV